MSDSHDDLGHGESPAAWIAVAIMLFGFALGTLFFFLGNLVVVYISAGIVIVGLLVGMVLARLGYGVNGSRYTAKRHD